ncbi:MAG: sialidase family protein [Acidimicrobiia bacterium]|nr:sialidase family protein [Acidimicrobiia bacterium]
MTKLEQRLQSAASDLNRHVRSAFAVPKPGLERLPRRLNRLAVAAATAAVCLVSLIAIALIAPFGPDAPVADEPGIVAPTGSTSPGTTPASPAGSPYAWTRVADPDLGGEGNQEIYSIRGVSSGLIAVGEDRYSPAVWASEDGLDWHRVNDATDAFGSEQSPYGEDSRRWLLDIAEGNGRLVAIGIDVLHRPGESHVKIDPAVKVMAFWYSDDYGSTWARVPDDGDAFRLGSGPLRSDARIIATPTGFLAVGEAIWTSPDGGSWTRANVPGSYVSDAIATGTAILAVGAVGPDDEWAYREAAWYSTDGTNWKSAGVETAPSFQGRFAAMAETGDGYFALGSGSRRLVWFSTDGFTWTFRGGYEENDGYAADQVHDIIAVDDTIVAVGAREAYLATAATVWESTDGGFTWTVREDQDVFGNPRSESRQSEAFSIVKFEDHIIVGGSFGNNLAQRGLLEGNGDAAVWVGTPTDY